MQTNCFWNNLDVMTRSQTVKVRVSEAVLATFFFILLLLAKWNDDPWSKCMRTSFSEICFSPVDLRLPSLPHNEESKRNHSSKITMIFLMVGPSGIENMVMCSEAMSGRWTWNSQTKGSIYILKTHIVYICMGMYLYIKRFCIYLDTPVFDFIEFCSAIQMGSTC